MLPKFDCTMPGVGFHIQLIVSPIIESSLKFVDRIGTPYHNFKSNPITFS